MARTADALEGLGIVGSATVGPLLVPTPALLLPEGRETPPELPTLRLSVLPSPGSGVRKYRIAGTDSHLDLEFEVPTPDLSSTPVPVRYDGTVAFVHGPFGDGELDVLAARRPELVVLSNARQLFREGRPFVDALRSVRGSVGSRPLLWAPRLATPPRVALLTYLGVDLLDATEALADAAEGRCADPDLGFVPPGTRGFCDCSAGAHSTPSELSEHAVAALGTELGRSRAALRAGRLRELVEARLTAEPLLAELLRYSDVLLGPRLEERAPVVGSGTRSYILRESFRRPEVRRFRGRFLERYRPPVSKSVLLLVPCSKTKPYRNSRSHRRFATAWESLPGPERVHLVSVTSPIGLVPRELEDLPPARHYDIPVTGDWDEAERAAVRTALAHLLERGHYGAVVVHLDPEEYGFLRDALPPGPTTVWTMTDDRSTSNESIDRLREALRGALASIEPPSRGTLSYVKQELEALAGMQFGEAAARRLFSEPLRLHGRPWFQRLSDGAGTDLATWREERGLFHLTVGGGLRIGAAEGPRVGISDGVDLRGDLFSPGVAWADASVRTGDAVVLVRNGEVQAVGEAALPGPLMAELGRGLAVRVRHRKGAPEADEPSPTPEAGSTTTGRSSSG